MLPEIEQLLILQSRDERIRDLNADLERLPREEDAAKLRLGGDLKAVESVDTEIKENEVAIKNLELDIETRRDTIAKLKVQQYETKKNDAFQALTHEIERYGEDITKLEDSELELMEVAETLKAKLDTAKEALAKTQSVVDAELELIDQRRKQCETQLAETQEERGKLAAEVDADLLDEFERLFASKKDHAVVELEAGICQGCHMKVTPATASEVRAEKTIARCDQCGRMLYAG